MKNSDVGEEKGDDDDDVVLVRTIDLPSSGKRAVIVTLNRPDQLNCFNTKLTVKLSNIFHDLVRRCQDERENCDDDDDDDIVAVILTGSGGSFCAGADLTDPPDPLMQSSDLPYALRRNPVHQMKRLNSVPILGVMHGHVATGGMELALACDILIGDDTAQFRDTHVKFGVAPCWGLSQRLSRRIGPGRAKFMSFTAVPIKAPRAYEWGLLDELVQVNAEGNGNGDGSGGGGDEDDPQRRRSHRHHPSPAFQRALEIADMIGRNQSIMVGRYKRVMEVEEHENVGHYSALKRERALGLAHYVEAVGDGHTLQDAKTFIADENRPRTKFLSSKL